MAPLSVATQGLLRRQRWCFTYTDGQWDFCNVSDCSGTRLSYTVHTHTPSLSLPPDGSHGDGHHPSPGRHGSRVGHHPSTGCHFIFGSHHSRLAAESCLQKKGNDSSNCTNFGTHDNAWYPSASKKQHSATGRVTALKVPHRHHVLNFRVTCGPGAQLGQALHYHTGL